MPYYLAIDHGPLEQIANTSGWAAFKQWAYALKRKGRADFACLVVHGWTEQVVECGKQIATALKFNPPTSETAKQIGENLATLLQSAEGAEFVSITDAMGPETDNDGL